jgi:hypothetical protein
MSIKEISLRYNNYIKQTTLDIKRQIGPDTIIVTDFNIPLSSVDRSSGQKHK